MIIPPHIPVYGDLSYRGTCPKEALEQISLVNKVRQEYPDSYGLIILHPRNEQLLQKGQFSSHIRHAAEGLAKGAADIICPGKPTLVMEIKRQNHTLSTWQDGQVEFLTAAQKTGAWVCVALGAVAAWGAFEQWVKLIEEGEK